MAKLFFILCLIVPFSGCSSSEQKYKSSMTSSDLEYMEDLSAILNNRSIEHEYKLVMFSFAAEISFKNEDNEIVGNLQKKLLSASNVKFDEKLRLCHIEAFKELDIEYFIKEKEDGIWLKWFPESEKERKLQKITTECIFREKDNAF